MPGARVVVQPPSESGGRRVRVDGQILGVAYSREDVEEFLRRAGLEDPDVLVPGLVEWRGGGPDTWS